MKNCSKDILDYHDDEVTLSADDRSEMRERRNTNRARLKRGLTKNKDPHPDWFVIQGSYAMKTMTQHPENDYDIDDGAAFSAEKLTSDAGTAMTAEEAKQMVCDALIEGGGLRKDPTVTKNCVRIVYADGTQVDIPVYRVSTDAAGNETLELAGPDWTDDASPTEITDWYQKEEKKTHKQGEDEPQLRRMTRLLKKYARAHLDEDGPSGLILTVVCAEKHTQYNAREDEAFRTLLQNVKQRLEDGRPVYNPADRSEELTKETDAAKFKKLADQISKTLETLAVLDDVNCSLAEARGAWDETFVTDYFHLLQESSQAGKAPYTPSKTEPTKPVSVKGPNTSA